MVMQCGPLEGPEVGLCPLVVIEVWLPGGFNIRPRSSQSYTSFTYMKKPKTESQQNAHDQQETVQILGPLGITSHGD